MTTVRLDGQPPTDPAIPADLILLGAGIAKLPPRFRDQLAPVAERAIEEAIFWARVVEVAREGLERYRLDLAIARFDLEATRRERESLRERLESLVG